MRIDDDDEQSNSSESEDVVLIKPEISPSLLENSDTVENLFIWIDLLDYRILFLAFIDARFETIIIHR